ncbi:MAG: NUDIX hydrolase [Acidimicrobiia bacterium]|nr:MAG: NUDIX hydrolase [Acidimicrobiia bacterium]
MAGFHTTGSRSIADVGFARLDEVTIEAPDGTRAVRYALRLPNAVAIVALDGDDVVLIEQFRAPIGEAILEIPAGMLDIPGEDAITAARRELVEEVGFSAGRLDHLTDILTSPGVTDELISLYLAEGIEPVPRRPEGPEERHATVVTMPLAEAVEQVRIGRIRDAKSVIGLLLVAQR